MTVGVLDAFLVTWSRARAAFGDGAPQDGSAYDQSPALLELQAEVAGGGPGQHWRGPGSDAYGHLGIQILGNAFRGLLYFLGQSTEWSNPNCF